MMLLKLQIILLLSSSIWLVYLIKMISQYKLELKYALLWLLLSVISIILSIFPSTISIIANILGVESPVNALFLLGILGAFVILFSLTMALSRASNNLKNLSQELAMTKHELAQIKDSIKGSDD